jgi:hypothetical protein
MTSNISKLSLRPNAFRFLLLLLLPASPIAAGGQTPGCTLARGVYTCDRASFQRTLKEAKTVAIEVGPRDRMARTQVKELVEALGKTAEPAESAADLTFVLAPADPDGVVIGPADQELGSLRIYAPGVEGQHGALLWGETFKGQPDMPWPSVVHMLIVQFQGRFEKR